MKIYGLVGKSLSHSFSKSYFEKKFSDNGLVDHQYKNFELSKIEQIGGVLQTPNLFGLNVTIPYKEAVSDFLDEIDPLAIEIGAINCVRVRKGKSKGFNTDVYGFAQSIKPFLDVNHQRALILGTGGASKAVAHALKQIGVEVFFVTSSSKSGNGNYLTYADLNELVMNSFKLVVNATPVGTFPNVLDYPSIPYQFFTPQHLAYDLVYNPAETQFMKYAKEFGAITMNGQSMLELQAEKSWEIWNQ